jgi:hypothetical protein
MRETAHVNVLAGRIGVQRLQWFSQRSFDNSRRIPCVVLPFARLAGYAERNRRL